jgi:hypothetical protein
MTIGASVTLGDAGVENAPRRCAPPLSRGDLRLLESPLERGAQRAACVLEMNAAAASSSVLVTPPKPLSFRPIVPVVDSPELFERSIRESYGRHAHPHRRSFSAHA